MTFRERVKTVYCDILTLTFGFSSDCCSPSALELELYLSPESGLL